MAKKMVRQSNRASSLLFKLDENRNTAYQYQTQLEEDFASLEKKLMEQQDTYDSQVKELNEKIDSLMNKIEESEEQKIRFSYKI